MFHWFFECFSPPVGTETIFVIVFGKEPPLFSKQSQMAQPRTPYPGTYPYLVLSPKFTYPWTFPNPVSSSQYAYSGPGPYLVASPQNTSSESKAPVSMQGKFECTKHSVLKHVHVGIYVWELWYYHPWYNYASIINKSRF